MSEYEGRDYLKFLRVSESIGLWHCSSTTVGGAGSVRRYFAGKPFFWLVGIFMTKAAHGPWPVSRLVSIGLFRPGW